MRILCRICFLLSPVYASGSSLAVRLSTSLKGLLVSCAGCRTLSFPHHHFSAPPLPRCPSVLVCALVSFSQSALAPPHPSCCGVQRCEMLCRRVARQLFVDYTKNATNRSVDPPHGHMSASIVVLYPFSAHLRAPNVCFIDSLPHIYDFTFFIH